MDKRKEFLSVLDFGAKGDGVTDDTEAFERALHSSGGNEPVLIPEGKYLISKPLDLKHGVLWAK